VTVAGRDLAALEARFRDFGFAPVYGGAHSNGVTHMSIVALADGAYVELISTLELGAEAPWWHRAIADDAGPCAWALGVEDISAEARRIAALGVSVRGPLEMSRRLPDGRVAEWTLAYVGDGEPGSDLPFLIEDRTPRAIRVPPSAAEGTGIATVFVGAPALEPAIARYREVFALAPPRVERDAELDTRVARFDDAPVALVERPDLAEPRPVAFDVTRPGGVLRIA